MAGQCRSPTNTTGLTSDRASRSRRHRLNGLRPVRTEGCSPRTRQGRSCSWITAVIHLNRATIAPWTPHPVASTLVNRPAWPGFRRSWLRLTVTSGCRRAEAATDRATIRPPALRRHAHHRRDRRQRVLPARQSQTRVMTTRSGVCHRRRHQSRVGSNRRRRMSSPQVESDSSVN